MNTKIQELINKNRTNWNGSMLRIRQIEQIASVDDDVVLHEYASHRSSVECKALLSDTEKLHFAYDCNGYIQGINVGFISMCW